MSKKQKQTVLPVVVGADANAERQAKEVAAICERIATATIQTGFLYYELCCKIRLEQIEPAIVREQMTKQGFRKQRITEVLRVANVPEAMWSGFQAKTIGFRKVLNAVRDAERTDIKNNVVLIGPLAGEVPGPAEPPVGIISQAEKPEKSAEDKRLATENGMNRAALALLNGAEKLDITSKTYKNGGGWVVVVTKTKPAKTKKTK